MVFLFGLRLQGTSRQRCHKRRWGANVPRFPSLICAQCTLPEPGKDLSHDKQPPQISPAQITPPSVPRVTYSSLAGTSSQQTTSPHPSGAKPSRDISHNRQHPQILLAKITTLCVQGSLLKPSREFPTQQTNYSDQSGPNSPPPLCARGN